MRDANTRFADQYDAEQVRRAREEEARQSLIDEEIHRLLHTESGFRELMAERGLEDIMIEQTRKFFEKCHDLVALPTAAHGLIEAYKVQARKLAEMMIS